MPYRNAGFERIWADARRIMQREQEALRSDRRPFRRITRACLYPALFCFALSATGCHTLILDPIIAAKRDYPSWRVYSGTRLFFTEAKDLKGSNGDQVLAALDLPFSFALDTVLLPITIPLNVKRFLDNRRQPDKEIRYCGRKPLRAVLAFNRTGSAMGEKAADKRCLKKKRDEYEPRILELCEGEPEILSHCHQHEYHGEIYDLYFGWRNDCQR
jgi:uncharacterized protein YceK